MRASLLVTIMRVGALLASLVVAAFAAPVAFADPPSAETEQFVFSLDIDCGTFVLHEDVSFTVRTTTFYDAEGDPARVQAQVAFHGGLTAPDGTMIVDHGHYTDTLDLAAGAERFAGIAFNYLVPGHGGVVQDRGLVVIEPDGDVIVRGPHELLASQSGDPAEFLCPLFT
jgi:hypothetical protein